MKKLLLLLLLAATSMLAVPEAIHAELPYRTFYYDSNQATFLRIQPIYTPADMDSARFAEPVDLHVGADDNVYVMDKGANRVVVLDPDGTVLRTIGADEGESMLSAPEGLFVTPEGIIYVADSGNQRIVVFDNEGNFLRDYKKPESTYMETGHFVPTKIVVDRRGVQDAGERSRYRGRGKRCGRLPV
ncbi:NHL repeat-containing protein [Paenibacillus sp. MCAF20]